MVYLNSLSEKLSRIAGEAIGTPKITAKNRERSTDGWIVLAVHLTAVARVLSAELPGSRSRRRRHVSQLSR
jgi:hypothetical protein